MEMINFLRSAIYQEGRFINIIFCQKKEIDMSRKFFPSLPSSQALAVIFSYQIASAHTTIHVRKL